MAMARRLTETLTDGSRPGSVAARARKKRWQQFETSFPALESMHVLDLGGRPDFWRAQEKRPEKVTVVNLESYLRASEPWIDVVVGDACRPPPEVAASRFDLVFSNSLIEHVGGFARRQTCADVIHGLSDRHWVQTPYRYFPIEPHWIFPGMQLLPLAARARCAQRWPLGHRKASNHREAVKLAATVELVGITELSYLFPRSTIWTERFAGMVKSLTAIKR